MLPLLPLSAFHSLELRTWDLGASPVLVVLDGFELQGCGPREPGTTGSEAPCLIYFKKVPDLRLPILGMVSPNPVGGHVDGRPASLGDPTGWQ